MLQEELLEKITDALPVESINVQLDGNRAVIELVSERFVGLRSCEKTASGVCLYPRVHCRWKAPRRHD